MAMDDNFNTPQALASLFELADLGLGFIALDKEEGFSYIKSKLAIFFNILGLKVKTKEEIPQEIKKKLKERNLARKKKDFKRADELRKEIEALGYALSDTASAVTITLIEKFPEKGKAH